ncbi:MAG: ChaN family lipoprotein [Chlorobi bacterium]|nr:ChaN family lipoprotein [Chlorobiota bacterium]
MKTKTLIFLLISFTSFAFKYDKPAYILYNDSGKEILYSKMIKSLSTADFVFFGESHTDPISHWLEYEITKDLYAVKKQNLVMGAEMFESDNQLILDEYLNGFFAAKKFEADARLWKNYKTDYKPLVEFAKDSGIYFVATDIPRRYASIVFKKGFEGLDSLSEEAKKFIAPLPINYDPEVACYKDMISFMKEGETEQPADSTNAEHKMKTETDTSAVDKNAEAPEMKDKDAMKGMQADSHFTENLPKAQAAKDATMAYFSLKNWEKGKLFIHFDGSYHSNNHEGIVWHLWQKNPNLNIKTIAVVQQKDISKLDEENYKLADYIICVPESMTQTNR